MDGGRDILEGFSFLSQPLKLLIQTQIKGAERHRPPFCCRQVFVYLLLFFSQKLLEEKCWLLGNRTNGKCSG